MLPEGVLNVEILACAAPATRSSTRVAVIATKTLNSERILGSLLRTERREQHDVADRLAAGEEHGQAVDAEADAAGRRHAVRQRLDVVRIPGHGEHVARVPFLVLQGEACSLLLRGVDLREGVAELHPGDEVLEALDEGGIVLGGPRERRQLDRLVVEDRGLDELGLDQGRESVVYEL